MNSLPPEPGSGAQAGMGMTPGELAGQENMPRRLARPRRSGFRIASGIFWAVFAVGVGAGGVAELTIGNVGGAVLCIVLAVLAGWHDYRIWTLKARRLLLII